MSTLSENDVLSQHGSEKVIQDNKGYIWISSYDGLNRYNGLQNKIYRYEAKNSNSLSGNRILSLYINKSNNLLIGLDGEGICRYNKKNDNFDRFYFANNRYSNNNRIHFMCQIDNGDYLIGTASGLLQIKNKNFKEGIIENFYKSYDGIDIRYVHQTKSKKFLIATKNCLFITNSLSEINPQKILSKTIYNIYYDAYTSYYWICTVDGLYKFNEKSGMLEPFHTGIRKIKSIVRDKENVLWCYSDDVGLFKIVNEKDGKPEHKLINTNKDIFFEHNNIKSLYVDYSNNLWITSSYKGIAYIDLLSANIRSLNPNDDIDLVRSIKQIDNTIWVGTLTNGLLSYEMEKDGLYKINKKIIPDEKFISDLFVDLQRNLWICGNSLYKYKGGKIVNLSDEHKSVILKKYGKPLSVIQDSYNYYWIAFQNAIICAKIESSRIDVISVLKYPYEAHIRLMWDKQNSSLWIGSRHYGLRYLLTDKSGKIKCVKHYFSNPIDKNTINSNHIWDIVKSENKDLIFIVTDTGINLINPKSHCLINNSKIDALNNYNIKALSLDKNNELWLNTTKGLLHCNKEYEIKNIYDKQNGLTSSTLTEASLFINDSILYLGTINGVNYLNINSIVKNPYRLKLNIFDFLVNKESWIKNDKINLESNKEIILNYNQNDIEIKFEAIQFNHASSIKYKYLLEGYDKEWHETGAFNPQATYQNLPAGNYEFKLLGCNNTGLWNDTPIIINICVKTMPLLSWYAFVIYFIVIIVILYFTFLYLKKRDKIKHQKLIQSLELKNEKQLNKMKINCYNDITHELRLPLTLICSPLEDLHNMELNDNAKYYLDLISYNTKKLLNLVDQYLDLNKLDLKTMKIIVEQGNIIAFLKGIKDNFNFISKKNNIQYSFICDESCCNAWYDSNKVFKIVSNVLSNAFKYTPDGGTITFFVECTDENIEIVIEDSGIGIGQEDLKNIFNRDFRTSDTIQIKGNGLGLNIVKQIIDIYKGKINVRSKINIGTSFQIILPISKESFGIDCMIERGDDLVKHSMPSVIENSENKDELSQAEKHLLVIIEDDEMLCGYMKKKLSDDYNVITENDGKLGWEQVLKNLPDIVISDIIVPTMSGLEVCETIKNNFRTNHIPVILTTAKDMDEDVQKGMSIGAHDYIIKPFSMDILKMKIDNILKSRDYLKKTVYNNIFNSKVTKIDNDEKETLSYNDEFFNKIIASIDKHIEDSDFGVEELANELFISRMQLYRKIKSFTGKNVSEFIRNYKLNKAKELLYSGKYNISEVAYKVGFNNLSYFSKTFKQLFGYMPSDIFK